METQVRGRNLAFPYELRAPCRSHQPIVHKKQQRGLLFKIYSFAILLSLLSAIAWIVLSSREVDIVERIGVPHWVWLLTLLIVLAMLVFIPRTSGTTIIRWTLALVGVFFTTCSANFTHDVNVGVLIACMLVSVILLGVLHFCGAKAAGILMTSALCTYCVLAIGLGTIIILAILMRNMGSIFIELGMGIVMLTLTVTSALDLAIYIYGPRNDVPINDTVGCVAEFYSHFVLGTIGMFFLTRFVKKVNIMNIK